MTLSVDLGAELENVVDSLVRDGRFASRTAVLREGVRLVEERESRLAELDASLQRGLKDVIADRVRPAVEVAARLQAKYASADRTR